MRFYALCNYYLSSIQQGIQTAHLVAEMVHRDPYRFMDWAEHHKTIVVLNGGNSGSLKEIKDFLDKVSSVPVVAFYEDDVSLNGAMTGVGVILDEKIYTAVEFFRKNNVMPYPINDEEPLTDKESDMVVLLSGLSLAK